jgi:hypothetical protein
MPKEIPMNIKKLMMRCLSLSLLVVLSGCGGGGGSAPPPNPATPVPTVMLGAYTGKIDNYDFFSMALPTADVTQVRWYGLTYRPTLTDIYSGQLSLGVDGAASATSLKAFLGNVLVTLTGNITAASLDAYTGNLTIPPSVTPVSVTSTALISSSYSATAAANLADVQGVWVGNWADGSNSFTGLQLSVGTTGASRTVSTNPGGFLYCTLDVSSALSANSRANFFDVTLMFVNQSGQTCPRLGQTLTGVALVYHPTVSTSQLRLIALGTDGQGISFTASR